MTFEIIMNNYFICSFDDRHGFRTKLTRRRSQKIIVYYSWILTFLITFLNGDCESKKNNQKFELIYFMLREDKTIWSKIYKHFCIIAL